MLLRSLVHKLSEEKRHRLRACLGRMRERLDIARFWKWEVSRTEAGPFDVLYVGRPHERSNAVSLLQPDTEPVSWGRDALRRTGRPRVVISESWLPEALCVPSHLASLVPLNRPLEEMVAGFDQSLRRRIRRGLEAGYRVRPVTDAGEIEQLYEGMMRPFAVARHGAHANPLELETVLRLARVGRVELLLKGEEPVGVQVGYSYTHRGTRRFRWERAGFPEWVFSDSKRFGEANAMIEYFGCRYAHETGHAYTDLGAAAARPDGRLLQFKRQQRPRLEATEQSSYFYLRVPPLAAARVFSKAPLFAVEPSGLVLHVGIEASASDQDVLARFHAWTWGGISSVRLWSERPLGPGLTEAIRALYKPHQAEPQVAIHAAVLAAA